MADFEDREQEVALAAVHASMDFSVRVMEASRALDVARRYVRSDLASGERVHARAVRLRVQEATVFMERALSILERMDELTRRMYGQDPQD